MSQPHYSSLLKPMTVVAGLMVILASAQPAHGWWFLPEKPQTSVQPKQSTGLVLNPLVASLIPKFILEPLQQTTTEQPPVAQNSQSSKISIQPLISPTPLNRPSNTTNSIAQRILDRVNQVRRQNSLDNLRLNAQLTKSAQDYARRMSSERFFSHTAPDGQTFRQRNEQAGYTNWQWMGENIAQGQTSVDQVMTDWLNSPAHRDNILSPKAKELGVGYVAGNPSFWVQEFGLQFE